MSSSGVPLFEFDEKLISKLKRSLAPSPKKICLVGIDEAGRGSWAGPVVAAAVSLLPDFFEPRLNDSKKLTPQLRLELYKKLIQSARWAVGTSGVETIDSVNILQATYRAMKRALDHLIRLNPELMPTLILIDGRPARIMGFPQQSIVKGDSKSAAIAAASVIAKVTRDRMMVSLDKKYPQYGFSRHKGYGTSLHQKNLGRFGPSDIHRKSFSPMRMMQNGPLYADVSSI